MKSEIFSKKDLKLPKAGYINKLEPKSLETTNPCPLEYSKNPLLYKQKGRYYKKSYGSSTSRERIPLINTYHCDNTDLTSHFRSSSFHDKNYFIN